MAPPSFQIKPNMKRIILLTAVGLFACCQTLKADARSTNPRHEAYVTIHSDTTIIVSTLFDDGPLYGDQRYIDSGIAASYGGEDSLLFNQIYKTLNPDTTCQKMIVREKAGDRIKLQIVRDQLKRDISTFWFYGAEKNHYSYYYSYPLDSYYDEVWQPVRIYTVHVIKAPKPTIPADTTGPAGSTGTTGTTDTSVTTNTTGAGVNPPVTNPNNRHFPQSPGFSPKEMIAAAGLLLLVCILLVCVGINRRIRNLKKWMQDLDRQLNNLGRAGTKSQEAVAAVQPSEQIRQAEKTLTDQLARNHRETQEMMQQIEKALLPEIIKAMEAKLDKGMQKWTAEQQSIMSQAASMFQENKPETSPMAGPMPKNGGKEEPQMVPEVKTQIFRDIEYMENQNCFVQADHENKIFEIYRRGDNYYYTIVNDPKVRRDMLSMINSFKCIRVTNYYSAVNPSSMIPVRDGQLIKKGDSFLIDTNRLLEVELQ